MDIEQASTEAWVAERLNGLPLREKVAHIIFIVFQSSRGRKIQKLSRIDGQRLLISVRAASWFAETTC